MKHFRISIYRLILWGVVSLLMIGAGYLVLQVGRAATNISSTYPDYFAWNDVVGWIDFLNTNTVNVTSLQLQGYASSTAGDISLDCATTRIGNICGTSDYKVRNDGAGYLSGWGWNDIYGWISFCGTTSGGNADCPNTPVTYQVVIEPTTGEFLGGTPQGWAWNDILGWISFNCDNTNCGVSEYRVVTNWRATSTTGVLDSSTFDTGVAGGAQFNYLLWHGSLPSDTSAQFQLAVSNSSSGPWNFIGPDGTGNSYYNAPVSSPVTLNYDLYGSFRYFRYRAYLVSNQIQTLAPRIDDVIINWSR